MYRYSTITNDSGNKNNYITPITTGMWTPKIEYVVNMRSHTFDVYYNDSLVASSLPFLNSSFTTADYIIFGTRATGFSKYWFKDVEIVPVEEEIISEINVSSSCLPYTSYTKDYLYSASDLSDKTVTVNNTSVNYGSDVISNETNYTNIDLVSSSAHGSIALNHRVYYELNVSREGITKSLEEALDLKEKNILLHLGMI